VQLLTTQTQEQIRLFVKIPFNISLSSNTAKQDFSNYMDRALIKRSNEYCVLGGFIKTSNDMAAKNYMKTEKCVFLRKYTKDSKLFIFPKEFINNDWLKATKT
jgi:hypothetical protein